MTRPEMELTCEDLVELVTEYLERTMSAPERARFEEHLDMCEGCRTYVDQIRTTLDVLGYVREEQIAPEAQERLLAAFRTWKREN